MVQIAHPTILHISNIKLEGLLTECGHYCMSEAQAAKSVDRTPATVSRFLRSQSPAALKSQIDQQGQLCFDGPDAVIEPSGELEGRSPIPILSMGMVTLFWLHQCSKGNEVALNLLVNLGLAPIAKRFDVVGSVGYDADRPTFTKSLSLAK